MGKRELVLILAFVALAVATYQWTAPRGNASQPGFSIGRLVDHIRREVGGDRVRSERQLSVRYTVEPDDREIRIAELRGGLRIVGEPRPDLLAEARLEVWGQEQDDADHYAAEAELTIDRSGDTLVAALRPPRRASRVRVDLTLRVPERLTVRLETVGRSEVTGVAEVVLNTRGDTSIQRVAGAVRGEQRGGDLRVADAARLDLVTRLCDVTLERIAEDVRIDATSGEVAVRGSPARVRIEARRADVRVDGVDQPIAIDHAEGEVEVFEARAAVRIDGRRTDVVVGLAAPAKVDISGTDGETIVILPAEGGMRVDAVVHRGELQLDGIDLAIENVERGRRVSGVVGGDGPAVTVRMERGRVILRRPTSSASSSAPEFH